MPESRVSCMANGGLGQVGFGKDFRQGQDLAGLQPAPEQPFGLEGGRQDDLFGGENENPISLRQVIIIAGGPRSP